MADDSKTSSENVRPTNVLPGALFLTGVTLASMVGGFGYAIGQARRRSPGSFDQRQQEGVKLAVRALGWGTVLAVSGVGFLVFGVKTALGVKDGGMKHLQRSEQAYFLVSFASRFRVHSLRCACLQAREFGLKMKGILPTKDGKFVSYFESWKIPRNKGRGNMDEWSSLSSKSESPKITEK